ncbi:SAG-related sequence SRS30A [Toxoplasma gondii MAS]|uniref:SAG-related sequence SRS30A n=1 Tax=Toxoplasma gondii MAS TaxID=943118 RepID=A0A086QWR5_TOXGO|nr:SAG-related sequence SRS30A [Toxoplasma gondii MAS]
MASSSRVRCLRSVPSCPVSRLSLGPKLRLGGGLLLFVSSLVVFGFLPFSQCVGTPDGGASATNPSCLTEGTETQCTCQDKNGSAKDLVATLSQNQNSLKIRCKQTDLKFVPESSNGKAVCPSTTTELKDCKAASTRSVSNSVEINTLLSGSPKDVSWKDVEGDNQYTSKKLVIPQEYFPSVDQKFIVGCVTSDSGTPATAMKVTVTLEAKASATQEQTVNCAYGSNSNKAHQAITLTPENNKFTLVCGDKGQILPTKYQETYCAHEDGKDAADTCKDAYSGIFPNYETTWWTKATEPPSNEYTFKIPEGQFPTEKQTFMVGCHRQTPVQDNAQKNGVDNNAQEAKPTVCTVDVTVAASAPSSAAELASGISLMLLSVASIAFSFAL